MSKFERYISTVDGGGNLTSGFDFSDGLHNYTGRLVWPIVGRRIIHQAYPENKVFAFADLMIIVEHRGGCRARKSVRYKVTDALEVSCGTDFRYCRLTVLRKLVENTDQHIPAG